MPFPETIQVKYTEEEAEFVSVRPVTRQNFRIEELIDMILSVTGKDPVRIQRILHSGTVVFHFYRYWWPALEIAADELAGLLKRFPDADPGRAFRAEECTAVFFERGAANELHAPLLRKEQASRRKLFRRSSAWDLLMELAQTEPPAYLGYSYEWKADVFVMNLGDCRERVERVIQTAPRAVRGMLAGLRGAARMGFVCPRQPAKTRP